MSIADAFTLEEIDAQIANIKRQLLKPNAGYSVSPSEGGASRSVSRNDRAQLNEELKLWMSRRKKVVGSASGSTTGRFRIRCSTTVRSN